MNPTTDPELRSFIPVGETSHFPIQNLPYGVFRPHAGDAARVGVAISGYVLDLAMLDERGLIDAQATQGQRVFARSSLNPFMALGPEAWTDVRSSVSHLLQAEVTTLRDDMRLREHAFWPMEQVEMQMPIEVGDYTDFYSSREHATNVGSMMRGPENALQPNWLHMPVAYHGRASSVIVSGADIRRPQGQRMSEGASSPVFGPSRAVDFELEMGNVVGVGSELGKPISTARALDHIFGMVLVNDWSARDIQKWEYQPLGPFLSKNFATSISPWVVPVEALEPFHVLGPEQHPIPLPYLGLKKRRTYDVHLEVLLKSEKMEQSTRLCASNLKHLYWQISQQVAHHTVTGCNLRCGDLLATGTISGPTSDSRGCLLELTRGGQEPIELPDGETRSFLEDHDQVTLSGWCQGDGYRVGFGECTATVLPAHIIDFD
jgi:fumarylacetoacetase